MEKALGDGTPGRRCGVLVIMRNLLHPHAVARLVAIVTLSASVAFVGSTASAGDDDQRIEFAAGTDYGYVEGTFREGEVDRYTLWAGAGQTMYVQLEPNGAGGAGLAVYDPSGTLLTEANGPGPHEVGPLPVSGDYVITVGTPRAEVNRYTLGVVIPALIADEPTDAPRVSFARGTDRATVHGTVAPGSTKRFVLRAGANQSMFIDVGPDSFAALTTILAPDGSVVGAGHTTALAFLPVDGDYIVEIANTGTTSEFAVTFRIPPVTS